MYQYDNMYYQCINLYQHVSPMYQSPMKALKTSTSTLECQSDITWKNHPTTEFLVGFPCLFPARFH